MATTHSHIKQRFNPYRTSSSIQTPDDLVARFTNKCSLAATPDRTFRRRRLTKIQSIVPIHTLDDLVDPFTRQCSTSTTKQSLAKSQPPASAHTPDDLVAPFTHHCSMTIDTITTSRSNNTENLTSNQSTSAGMTRTSDGFKRPFTHQTPLSETPNFTPTSRISLWSASRDSPSVREGLSKMPKDKLLAFCERACKIETPKDMIALNPPECLKMITLSSDKIAEGYREQIQIIAFVCVREILRRADLREFDEQECPNFLAVGNSLVRLMSVF